MAANRKISCLCVAKNLSSFPIILFLVLYKKYDIPVKTSSVNINTILANIAPIPAIPSGIYFERPRVITPSLTPSPIGVINDAYPAKNEKLKKPINVKKSGRYKEGIAETEKNVPRDKKVIDISIIPRRSIFALGLK